MIDNSIILRLDPTLLALCEPRLKNVGAFALPIGTEETFHFPFVADSSLVQADSQKLYERMNQRNFFLCISQIPERRLIQIPNLE